MRAAHEKISLDSGGGFAIRLLMPRKLLIKTSDFPYHVTNRSNNKEFFYLPSPQLWQICLEVLTEVEKQFGCHLHAFVLMSNHYHLLISTPHSNIGDAMKYFHREIARQANREAGRINHFFGGRYKWSVISEEDYYWNSVKYIFRNPVSANLCQRVEEYPYSSYNARVESPKWRMVDFFRDDEVLVSLDSDWLNESFSEEQAKGIARALRRREFKLSANKLGGKVRLEASVGVLRREKGTVT